MKYTSRKIRIIATASLVLTVPVIVYIASLKHVPLPPRAAAPPLSGSLSLAARTQATVLITGSGFFPDTIAVSPGQQVVWKNTDLLPHQPASDPHPLHTAYPGFECPEPLWTDDAYGFTFERRGTFTYHDHLNPLKFSGTVIVR